MQDELECLREDHLIALRREVEASIAALKSLEQVRQKAVYAPFVTLFLTLFYPIDDRIRSHVHCVFFFFVSPHLCIDLSSFLIVIVFGMYCMPSILSLFVPWSTSFFVQSFPLLILFLFFFQLHSFPLFLLHVSSPLSFEVLYQLSFINFVRHIDE